MPRLGSSSSVSLYTTWFLLLKLWQMFVSNLWFNRTSARRKRWSELLQKDGTTATSNRHHLRFVSIWSNEIIYAQSTLKSCRWTTPSSPAFIFPYENENFMWKLSGGQEPNNDYHINPESHSKSPNLVLRFFGHPHSYTEVSDNKLVERFFVVHKSFQLFMKASNTHLSAVDVGE